MKYFNYMLRSGIYLFCMQCCLWALCVQVEAANPFSKVFNNLDNVVTGTLDTIFLNYSNTIALPKKFRKTTLHVRHVESKKASLQVERSNDILSIDQIMEEGYYFLELINKQQVTVFQQLLFAKKMANPGILLNNDTVLVDYTKAELLHKLELGLRFEEAEAVSLCTLVSYDLIVLPYKQEPLQTRLTRANNFSSDRKIELLNLLNAQSRVFISDIMVQFSNEKEPRNIGSAFFVIRDAN